VTEPAFLLDANICIYVLADAGGVPARRVQSHEEGSVVTSSIVYAEVMRGIPASEGAALESARRLFRFVEPLAFDRAAAERYADLPFRRASFDRLLAAQALSLDLVLVTNNGRAFADIPGLKVENWTSPL
jgi:tRNA(fMet)-specific endonuclease VapC